MPSIRNELEDPRAPFTEADWLPRAPFEIFEVLPGCTPGASHVSWMKLRPLRGRLRIALSVRTFAIVALCVSSSTVSPFTTTDSVTSPTVNPRSEEHTSEL